jgi:hypothetical protein|tara:strand:- start:153 stop:356 length:204 start_codon:yes stop_codon:yes gene_type:complete
MGKKKKHKIRIRDVEVINITTRKRKMINLDDETVVFDEKSRSHQVLPVKKPIYVGDDSKNEEEEEIL